MEARCRFSRLGRVRKANLVFIGDSSGIDPPLEGIKKSLPPTTLDIVSLHAVRANAIF